MRLDKYIAGSGLMSRKDAARAVSKGSITVNGAPAKSAAAQINEETDVVCYLGERVSFKTNIYILLEKPAGYISARSDGAAPVVTSLCDPYDATRVFPCGRLDKYTTGLMLLTDNGELSHRLLSPARHVAKTYRYTARLPLSTEAQKRLSEGVHIAGGYLTSPCKIEPEDEYSGLITITEGKYHQIKQMFYAVGNEITALSRESFGPLRRDGALAPGEWRYLTHDETEALLAAVGMNEE